MSGQLQEMLDSFRNDNVWNTLMVNGSHRFDKEIAWIEEMVKSYAERLNLSVDRVAEIMEETRDYAWPNYYQPANFPGIDSDSLIGVFETCDAFLEHAKEHWKGFICPKCGDVSPYPQLCIHRVEKDGKCDWRSYGLFRSGRGVIILEDGLKLNPIFDPVEKENSP